MPSQWLTLRWLESRKSTARIQLKKKKGRIVMRRRVWILVLAAPVIAAATLLVSGTRGLGASAEQAQASNVEVKIDNFSFGPATLTVAAGTRVTWTNRDDIPHTVVSDDKVFKSKVLDTDEKFSFTFTKPGTYGYFCSIHPKMTGKVVVE
jgi:plastocyanin